MRTYIYMDLLLTNSAGLKSTRTSSRTRMPHAPPPTSTTCKPLVVQVSSLGSKGGSKRSICSHPIMPPTPTPITTSAGSTRFGLELRLPRCQYLYFCTSKASKLSTCALKAGNRSISERESLAVSALPSSSRSEAARPSASSGSSCLTKKKNSHSTPPRQRTSTSTFRVAQPCSHHPTAS
jgi:hypothetical protein